MEVSTGLTLLRDRPEAVQTEPSGVTDLYQGVVTPIGAVQTPVTWGQDVGLVVKASL